MLTPDVLKWLAVLFPKHESDYVIAFAALDMNMSIMEVEATPSVYRHFPHNPSVRASVNMNKKDKAWVWFNAMQQLNLQINVIIWP